MSAGLSAGCPLDWPPNFLSQSLMVYLYEVELYSLSNLINLFWETLQHICACFRYRHRSGPASPEDTSLLSDTSCHRNSRISRPDLSWVENTISGRWISAIRISGSEVWSTIPIFFILQRWKNAHFFGFIPKTASIMSSSVTSLLVYWDTSFFCLCARYSVSHTSCMSDQPLY